MQNEDIPQKIKLCCSPPNWVHREAVIRLRQEVGDGGRQCRVRAALDGKAPGYLAPLGIRSTQTTVLRSRSGRWPWQTRPQIPLQILGQPFRDDELRVIHENHLAATGQDMARVSAAARAKLQDYRLTCQVRKEASGAGVQRRTTPVLISDVVRIDSCPGEAPVRFDTPKGTEGSTSPPRVGRFEPLVPPNSTEHSWPTCLIHHARPAEGTMPRPGTVKGAS